MDAEITTESSFTKQGWLIAFIRMEQQSTARWLKKYALAFCLGFLIAGAILVPTKIIPAQHAHKRALVDINMKKNLKLAAWAMEKRWEHGEPKGTYRVTSASDLLRWGFQPTDGVMIVVVEADDDAFKLKATAEGGTASALVFDSRSQAILPGR